MKLCNVFLMIKKMWLNSIKFTIFVILDSYFYFSFKQSQLQANQNCGTFRLPIHIDFKYKYTKAQAVRLLTEKGENMSGCWFFFLHHILKIISKGHKTRDRKSAWCK